MVLKAIYSNEELDRQMDYQDKKCLHCMRHGCTNSCKTQRITEQVAERTPTITQEQKRRYFDLMRV